MPPAGCVWEHGPGIDIQALAGRQAGKGGHLLRSRKGTWRDWTGVSLGLERDVQLPERAAGLQRREGTKLDNTPVRGVRVWTRGSSWGTERRMSRSQAQALRGERSRGGNNLGKVWWPESSEDRQCGRRGWPKRACGMLEGAPLYSEGIREPWEMFEREKTLVIPGD